MTSETSETSDKKPRRTAPVRALDAVSDLTMAEHGEFVSALVERDRDLAERLHKKLDEALND